MEPERKEFLFKMYDQMFNDINRHILVIWQSIGVVVGAFAIFALVEKNIVSIDVASGIILLLCAWSIGHIYDASYWYNRNLVIIANIEKQFLNTEDIKLIHFYFLKHRKDNKMISHLRMQYALGVGLTVIILLYHFSQRVAPGLSSSIQGFQLERAIPYIVTVVSVFYLIAVSRGKNARYEEFLEKSPGKDIEGLELGKTIGHGQ